MVHTRTVVAQVRTTDCTIVCCTEKATTKNCTECWGDVDKPIIRAAGITGVIKPALAFTS